jgi:hypothetical protein
VQARCSALCDRTPVVLANLGSDRYHPGSLTSERPVLVVRWGLLSMVVRSLYLSGVNSHWQKCQVNIRLRVDHWHCTLALQSRCHWQLELVLAICLWTPTPPLAWGGQPVTAVLPVCSSGRAGETAFLNAVPLAYLIWAAWGCLFDSESELDLEVLVRGSKHTWPG